MGQLKGQNVELKNELKNVRTGENSNGEENWWIFKNFCEGIVLIIINNFHDL
jgi:hypothetical protein